MKIVSQFLIRLLGFRMVNALLSRLQRNLRRSHGTKNVGAQES